MVDWPSSFYHTVKRRVKRQDGGGSLGYRPVNSKIKEIRVLEVHPGDASSPLRCTLRHAVLREGRMPPYETISYCWGDPTPRATMTLGKSLVLVPASTADALRRVRLPDVSRRVWIDAICIDQENAEEKSNQVAFMSTIYQNSQRNLIYLGEDDADMQKELRNIRLVLDEVAAATSGDVDFEAHCYEMAGNVMRTRFCPDPLDPNIDVATLSKFLARPWFSRLWVFQEAAVAPASVCLCGASEVPFVDVVRAAIWVLHKFNSATASYHALNMPRLTEAAAFWPYIDDVRAGGRFARSEKIDLSQAWVTLRNRKCLDPRDRVYGMLGVAGFGLSGRSIPPELFPDYTRPVRDVWRDAARYMLQAVWFPSQLLCYVDHSADNAIDTTVQASWVPNFDPNDGDAALRPSPLHSYGSFTASAARQRQRSDGTREPVSDPALLSWKGMLIGQVAATLDCLERETLWNGHDLREWLSHAQRFAAEKTNARHHGPTQLSLCLTAGTTRRRQPVSQEDAVAGMSAMTAHLDRTLEIPPLRDLAQPRESTAWDDASDYHLAMHASASRTVFTSKDGRFGLGPRITQEGDLVAILWGCSTPFVLRRRGKHFLLVGECYLHGAMYGAAVEEFTKMGFPESEFVLA